MRFLARVHRFFHHRLEEVCELSDDQINIIIGCLFDALSEAVKELVVEMPEDDA